MKPAFSRLIYMAFGFNLGERFDYEIDKFDS